MHLDHLLVTAVLMLIRMMCLMIIMIVVFIVMLTRILRQRLQVAPLTGALDGAHDVLVHLLRLVQEGLVHLATER